jgi:5-methyltetrahydrofolate--homocysteine methyltransferase
MEKTSMDTLIEEIYQGVLDGQSPVVHQKVQAALAANIPASTILNEGMIAAMAQVGQLFEDGEYFVPEMLISARAMQAGLTLLKPALKSEDVKSSGKVIIGTVKGDLHDIGKNLVAMMMEGAGFEIVDLGTDVSPEKFINAIHEHQPEIIAMSALLTTTMPNMVTTIQALKEAGVRDQVKVLIGGAPVTENYARQIGADGFATDASRAVNVAKSLITAS